MLHVRKRRLWCALAVGLSVCVVAACAWPIVAECRAIGIKQNVSLLRQFGYRPAYPLSIPSFDMQNRPVFRSRTTSQHETRHAVRLRGGRWRYSTLLTAVRRAFPAFVATVNAGGYVSERIEFDTKGRAYTLLEVRLRNGALHNALLYSVDDCRTWRALRLPFGGKRPIYDARDSGTAALEQYAGWNVRDVPPLVAVWRPVSDWPGRRASRNAMYVVRPRFRDGRLVLPAPTLVTDRYIGQCYAAGGSSFAASAQGTSFLVWAEVARKSDSGTPIYACSFDEADRKVGPRVLVAQTRPRNDDHNMPGIVRDGDGYLHILTGAHNSTFYYVRSQSPLSADVWTRPQPLVVGGYVADGGTAPGRTKLSYVSLACLPDDSLVVAFRQWRRGIDTTFRGGGYEALCTQRRSPEGEWGRVRRLVFCRTRPGYANYHQKLTVDRAGALYLSLSYFHPKDYPKAARAENRYHHRMVLISEDGGLRWRFATNRDFRQGVMSPVD